MKKHSGSLLLAAMLTCSGLCAQEEESLLLNFREHDGPVYSIAIHPEGNLIASAAEDRLIHIWNPDNGDIRKTLEGNLRAVKYLTWSPDGRYLLSAASTEIRIWDIENDTWKAYPGHRTHVMNLAFNRDASRFLSTSLQPKFREWEVETAEVVHEYEAHSRTCLAVAYRPDNRQIASGSLDQSIKIWDAGTREVVHDISAHGGNIMSLDYHPEGKWLASASVDENIKLWDSESGKIHKLLSGHSYAVVFVRFSGDGRYLLSASYDRTARLWELSTGNCIYTFIDHEDALYQADFFPDSRRLATCSNDGTVRVYAMSPRFTAEFYFYDEIQDEMRASGLFEARRRGEKRDAYRKRQTEAAHFRQTLYRKYHQLHLEQTGR